MNSESSVASRAVLPLIAGLEILGFDADNVLETCGLPRSELMNPDGRVPHSTMMVFWQVAVEASRDENLGLHLAEAAPLESFGVHTYALESSSSLREAYRRAARYQRLIHEVTELVFQEGAEEGVLRHALPGGRSVPRQVAEFLATLWLRFGRRVVGTDWAPRLVCFDHEPPSDLTEHVRIFRTAIRFQAGSTAMHIPNQILDESSLRSHGGLIRVLDDYADRVISRFPTSSTQSGRVRNWLAEHLVSRPTAEMVAESFHVSVRTLHRSLQREGTTFWSIFDQLRWDLAKAYLSNPRQSVTEVASLLGFSEVSSFHRAFVRWSGTTPATFRSVLIYPRQTGTGRRGQ